MGRRQGESCVLPHMADACSVTFNLGFCSLRFPCGSAGEESACSVGDLGSIPGLGRSPGDGKCYPLQYSGLENPMDCTVHWVENSWTRLHDFHFHFVVYLASCCAQNLQEFRHVSFGAAKPAFCNEMQSQSEAGTIFCLPVRGAGGAQRLPVNWECFPLTHGDSPLPFQGQGLSLGTWDPQESRQSAGKQMRMGDRSL